MTLYQMTVDISSPVLGGQGVNIWHLRNTGPAPDTASELNGLSELVHQFYESIDACFHGDTLITFDGTMTEVGSDEPSVFEGLDTWGTDGGTSVPNLPPANCIVAAWGTASATRRGHGRTFLGPLSRDCAEDNGTPVEAIRSLIVSAGQDLISASEGLANGALGVYSTKDKVLRDFTSIKVANRFAVLRSRRD